MFDLDTALAAIRSRNRDMGIEPLSAVKVDRDTSDQRRARSRQLERDILSTIDFLQAQPDSELKATRLTGALDRLGELLAEQGRYQSAIDVTRDPARKAQYARILESIERPAEEMCGCVDDKATTKQGVITLPARIIAEKVVKDDQEMGLELCTKCGFSNTR